jgi:hypothetical protein
MRLLQEPQSGFSDARNGVHMGNGGTVNRRYWDEHIETMSPAELERLEAPLIAEQIAYVYAKSCLLPQQVRTSGGPARHGDVPGGARSGSFHREGGYHVGSARRCAFRPPSMRTIRRYRPHCRDWRHQRLADTHRLGSQRCRTLERNGRAGALGHGLPAGRLCRQLL